MVAEPRAAQSPQEELAAIRSQLADFRRRHDELIAQVHEPDFEQRKAQFISDVADQWTALADREFELMKEVGEIGSRKSLNEFFNAPY